MSIDEEVIKKVADSLGLSKDFVSKVYKNYWRAIRDHIKSLPLKENLTDEEFKSLQPNVNIPSIGKLYVTLDRYKRIKKMNEIRNKIKDNNVTHQED